MIHALHYESLEQKGYIQQMLDVLNQSQIHGMFLQLSLKGPNFELSMRIVGADGPGPLFWPCLLFRHAQRATINASPEHREATEGMVCGHIPDFDSSAIALTASSMEVREELCSELVMSFLRRLRASRSMLSIRVDGLTGQIMCKFHLAASVEKATSEGAKRCVFVLALQSLGTWRMVVCSTVKADLVVEDPLEQNIVPVWGWVEKRAKSFELIWIARSVEGAMCLSQCFFARSRFCL